VAGFNSALDVIESASEEVATRDATSEKDEKRLRIEIYRVLLQGISSVLTRGFLEGLGHDNSSDTRAQPLKNTVQEPGYPPVLAY
jgi:hypothetical protein